MFGMSSDDFWENDPQLYWAYRTFYLKQKEVEQEEMKYEIWLKGSIDFMATSMAIQNSFGKANNKYPSYEELFNGKKQESSDKKGSNAKKTKKSIDIQVQEENIAWARY